MWAIILAGGEGTRVRSLTTGVGGEAVPKQYCSFGTGKSLLRRAIDRAAGIVSAERIVTVVASHHRRWWERQLWDLPVANTVVQPRNRGTAAGILLPLICVLRRDPAARIVVIPSDHYVDHESRLRAAMLDAVLAADAGIRRVVLLGVVPRDGDAEYGWIVPVAAERGTSGPARKVETFVEKPDPRTARALMRRGAVLNSFIFTTPGATLMRLYERAAPHLLERFDSWRPGAPGGRRVLATVYEDLPTYDFSRDILERSCDRLWVVPAPGCGWIDLGTPERLRDFGRTRYSVPGFPVPGPSLRPLVR